MAYTLITGASSGIGEALAHIMAQHGHHLILVARRKALLLALQAQLKSAYHVEIEVVEMDLSEPNQPEILHAHCQAQGWVVNGLVNNAGFGDFGAFSGSKLALYQNMLQLNIMALTALTAYFLPDMRAKGDGKILNVGSIAAFQPIPNFSVYAASKAYVMQFTEALSYELRGTGVSVTLLSPGVTETGFVQRANMGDAANAQGQLMAANEVALQAYRAMMRGQLNVTPGWKNKLLTFGSRIMPSREGLLRISALITRVHSH